MIMLEIIKGWFLQLVFPKEEGMQLVLIWSIKNDLLFLKYSNHLTEIFCNIKLLNYEIIFSNNLITF